MQKPDSKTQILIKIGNQEKLGELSIAKAVLDYDNQHYTARTTLEHGLGHLIASGLARPNFLMNYGMAAHDKPLYQAGFQAEIIATIYDSALINKFAMPEEHSDAYIKKIEADFIKRSLYLTRKDIFNELNNKNDKSHKKLYGKLGYKHFDNYINYLKRENIVKDGGMAGGITIDEERLWRPPIEEVIFHVEKAVEIREKIKEFTKEHPSEFNINTSREFEGKYPNELTEEELAKIPLKAIITDNTSPWDIAEKEKRAQLRKEFYGANTAGHALINNEPSKRQK